VFKEFFWHNRFCRLGEDLPSRLSTKVFCLISSNFLHYDFIKLVNTIHLLAVFLQVSKSDLYK